MIKKLVRDFRDAIDIAKNEGAFSGDFSFYKFPQGCCGDACDLIAQYLLDNGIKTWYVSGNHYPTSETEEENWGNFQSHAWLTTDDLRSYMFGRP